MPVLYGPDNQPLDLTALRDEIAAPTLVGIRSVWVPSVAPGLTPARLSELLLSSAETNISEEYLYLAEEMEERDPHYASVLGTRKRAVSGLEPSVAAASDDSHDQELADAVRELIAAPAFAFLVDDLLDALGKGYSVVEIMWDRTQRVWTPQAYEWRPPHFFQFDLTHGTKLRLRDYTPEGTPLPAAKFIVHLPRLKTGLPLRGGLARLVAVAYMCKSYTLKDWMTFAEVFGMPLRLGRYGPSATAEDIQTLIRAVSNLGTDAAAVLPDSMRIEFPAVVEGTATNLYRELAEWLDRQVSKAVLGQVATTEGTPGKLGNDAVQEDVRYDILKSDARTLAATLNRDLVRPYIDLNWGLQKAYPSILIMMEDAEDTQALATVLEKLVPLGLRVEASIIRDKLGLPDPPEGAEVLEVGATHASPLQQGRPTNRALNQNEGGEPDIFEEALQAALDASDKPEALEAISEDLVAPILEAADENPEQLLGRLAELYPDLDATALQDRLDRVLFVASLLGHSSAEAEG